MLLAISIILPLDIAIKQYTCIKFGADPRSC